MAQQTTIEYPVIRVPAPASLREDTMRYLRWLEPERCVVFASWAALEPEEGQLDAEALENLRRRLIAVSALDIEPVLCLYRGEDPVWFTARGGWHKEDNLRCYLRYIGRVIRAVGHLAAEYITFYAPNQQLLRLPLPMGNLTTLSHAACVHVRAYRLIRDLREARQLGETRVGFVLHVVPESDLRRGLLHGRIPPAGTVYQQLAAQAMARGDFRAPLRNVLRVHPGTWTDFIGIIGPQGEAKRRECCRAAREWTGAEAWVLEE